MIDSHSSEASGWSPDCSREQPVQVASHRVVGLAQNLVRIKSPLWAESDVARFLMAYLQGIGLDTELQAVPLALGQQSHQTIGRWRGKRPGPKVLVCGHLDTSGWGEDMYRFDKWTMPPYGGIVRDGWLYGVGSLNMKGGVAAMVGAVEALRRADFELRGEIVVACVMGETGGGVGVRHLLGHERDFDLAIVTEPTNQTVATISVGYVQGWIRLQGELRHFQPYRNPISAAARVIDALGPSYFPLKPGDLMTFEPCIDLPGYPRLAVRKITSGQDDCALFFDVRTVPGQTDESVYNDLTKLVHQLEPTLSGIQVEVVIPASLETPNFPALPALSRDHRLPRAVSQAHTRLHGQPPQVGAGDRIGLASDASHLKAAGIATVEYGPGKHPVWPMVDERIRTEDIRLAAQVLAETIVLLCA